VVTQPGGVCQQLFLGYGSALTIQAGGQLTNTYGNLALDSGSTATVTVSGLGSTWTNTSDLTIGWFGTGTLNVQAGGQVTSAAGYLGQVSGGNGAATVNGAGSSWTNNGDLVIGAYGTGTLTVSNAGVVTAHTLYTSLCDLHGDGTIAARGAVLDVDLVFDATRGPTQSLAFGSGGTLDLTVDGTGCLGAGYKQVGSLRVADGVTITSAGGYLAFASGSTGAATVSGAGSTWAISGALNVGYLGDGSLNVHAGAHVSSMFGYVALNAGSIGAAAVSGAGSTWDNIADLYVGSSGSSGTLTVTDAGLVTAQTLFASIADLQGNGTITARGAVLDANLAFDAEHGLSQGLAFGSGGTLSLTFDGSGSLGAGYKGTGTLRIGDGFTIASTRGYIAYATGSTGTATVSDAGSTWASSISLDVGFCGNGILTIQDGAQVTSPDGCLGRNAGSSGVANVIGPDSKWLNASSLLVGYVGSGTLNVQNGGQVSDNLGYLSHGTATITGPGSKWINATDLTVGKFGPGILNILAGGQVSSARGTVGGRAPGTAMVSGSGSMWINSGNLYVSSSGYGTGTLTVANAGRVTAQNLTLDSTASTIRLCVSGDNMVVLGNTATPGTLSNSGQITFYAPPSLPAATYHPISEFAGRAISWSGSGSYTAIGGAWDNVAHTFTVSPVTEFAAGSTAPITTAQRLLFTDGPTGQQIAASFGTVPANSTFSASLATQDERNKLLATPGFTGSIRCAWDFSTTVAGEVLLSAHIDPAAENPIVWQYQGGAWTQYTPTLLTTSSDGLLSFTADHFSGYAVSAVPEPATLSVLAATAAFLLLSRRRARKEAKRSEFSIGFRSKTPES
jgi:T5SS/PEP-CTERM-associated repeat protein